MPSHMSVVIVQDSFVILFIVAVGFWFAVLSDEVTLFAEVFVFSVLYKLKSVSHLLNCFKGW